MKYYERGLRIYLFVIFALITNTLALANTNIYYNVVDYGVIADGKALNTKAIQRAIDDCNKDGGGTVEFPAGTYLTGTIFLKNNVVLNLQPGSIILGSKNIDDYPKYVHTKGSIRHSALIQADNHHNIGIRGFGIIDGQGASFQGKKARPHLVNFIRCKNVMVEGVILQHPAAWTQHYFKCDGVSIRDIKIYAHGAENNDMVDIDQSRNVIITGLIGDSDDDGITLKSVGAELVENVVISNCIIRTRTNAIKAGTESYGGFRDITIINCTIGPSQTSDGFSGADEGLAGIALEIVDGGLMENVVISNLTMDKTTAPIFIRLGNRARTYDDLEKRPIGSINNISISNIIARNASKTGCSIVGEVGHPIKNVSLSNVRINYMGGGRLADGLAVKPELVNEYPECVRLGILPAYGFFVRHAEELTFRDVELTYNSEEYRPAMVFNDVRNLKILNFNAETNNDALGQLVMQQTQDVFINGCSPASSTIFLRLEQNCKNINLTGNNFAAVPKPFYLDETIDTEELTISSNANGKSTVFEILQPNIERDSSGMVSIYYPNKTELFYTTDGKDPNKSSRKYTEPFIQIDPVVIKARAFEKNKASGIAKSEMKRLNVLAPQIFPLDQFFNEKIEIKLISPTRNAEIYYTTDGTRPEKTSLKYQSPIIIQKKLSLRTIALKDGLDPSDESISKYESIEKMPAVQYKYYEGRWTALPNFIDLTPDGVGVVKMFTLEGLEHNDLYFGLVMHGYLSILIEGNYTFFSATNDGSKILIDNREVVNNDGAHAVLEKSGKIYLEKGIHLLELRYFQSGGGKDLKVSWQGPGFEKREMTSEDLTGH